MVGGLDAEGQVEILACVGHQNLTTLFPEYVTLVWSKLVG